MTWLLLLPMLFFTLCSGLVSAAQVSLFSLTPTQIKSYSKSEDRHKKTAASLLQHPRQLLVTLFMADVLVNLLVQNFASGFFSSYSSWLLNVGVPLVLTLIFGDILPKAFALARNQKVATKAAPIIFYIFRLVRPLRLIIVDLASMVSHALFFFLKKPAELSREEILELLHRSEERELLDKREGRWIRGFLWFQGATAKEVMQPRDALQIYCLHDSLEQLHLCFEKNSRVVVCRENLESPVGVLSSRDYFLLRPDLKKAEDLVGKLRPLWFVPEHMKARVLISQSKERDALVVDEYSTVRGLITYTDIIENIFGTTPQLPTQTSEYTLFTPGALIASATLELALLEQLLHIPIENPHGAVTLGGWLSAHLGSIPKTGFQTTIDGLFLHVLAAEPRRIQKIYVRKGVA